MKLGDAQLDAFSTAALPIKQQIILYSEFIENVKESSRHQYLDKSQAHSLNVAQITETPFTEPARTAYVPSFPARLVLSRTKLEANAEGTNESFGGSDVFRCSPTMSRQNMHQTTKLTLMNLKLFSFSYTKLN